MTVFAQNWIVDLQGVAFAPMLERSKHYSGEHQATSCGVSGTFWLVENH